MIEHMKYIMYLKNMEGKPLPERDGRDVAERQKPCLHAALNQLPNQFNVSWLVSINRAKETKKNKRRGHKQTQRCKQNCSNFRGCWTQVLVPAVEHPTLQFLRRDEDEYYEPRKSVRECLLTKVGWLS